MRLKFSFQTFLPRRDPEIRLRHVLRAGIMLEERGIEFYENMAKSAGDRAAEYLCRRLARDEDSHRRLLEKMLSGLARAAADSTGDGAVSRILKRMGIFSSPPSASASLREMTRYAVEQEAKSVDFYMAFRDAFPQEWKKMRIERLIREEKSHIVQLDRYYRLITGAASA